LAGIAKNNRVPLSRSDFTALLTGIVSGKIVCPELEIANKKERKNIIVNGCFIWKVLIAYNDLRIGDGRTFRKRQLNTCKNVQ
jgi:hypothetical protein